MGGSSRQITKSQNLRNLIALKNDDVGELLSGIPCACPKFLGMAARREGKDGG